MHLTGDQLSVLLQTVALPNQTAQDVLGTSDNVQDCQTWIHSAVLQLEQQGHLNNAQALLANVPSRQWYVQFF